MNPLANSNLSATLRLDGHTSLTGPSRSRYKTVPLINIGNFELLIQVLNPGIARRLAEYLNEAADMREAAILASEEKQNARSTG